MFIAIINIEDKKIKNNKKAIELLVVFIFIIISIGDILGIVADSLNNVTGEVSKKIAPWIEKYKYNEIAYIESNFIDDENEIEKIKQYIKNEPYDCQDIMYETMINQIIKRPNTEDIQFLIDTWKTIPRERTYDVNSIQQRAEIMLKLAKELFN